MFDSLREQLPVALGSFSPSPANIRQRTMDHKHLLSPSDSIYYLTPVCRARSGAQSPVQLSLPSRCLENSRVAGKKSFLSHLSKYKPVLTHSLVTGRRLWPNTYGLLGLHCVCRAQSSQFGVTIDHPRERRITGYGCWHWENGSYFFQGGPAQTLTITKCSNFKQLTFQYLPIFNYICSISRKVWGTLGMRSLNSVGPHWILLLLLKTIDTRKMHTLWWKALGYMMVHFVSVWLGHKAPGQFMEQYSGCACKRVFRVRLSFELVDWVKRLPSLLWVGLIQSTEGLNRTKRLTLPHRGKGVPFLPTCLSWGISLSCLRTWPETSVLPGSRACQLSNCNLHHWLFWVSSLLPEDFGTSQPPLFVSQFPIINLYMYI